jgi:hypothetical protein
LHHEDYVQLTGCEALVRLTGDDAGKEAVYAADGAAAVVAALG